VGQWRDAVWVLDPSAPGRRPPQRFTYRAYVPDNPDPDGLTFSAATAADIADAEAAIAVVNHSQHLVAMQTLARLLLRSESVASSRIEGLECSQRRLAEAAFAPEHAGETARQVLANIDAMRQAIDLGAADRDLTIDDVKDMHELLMRAGRATGPFASEATGPFASEFVLNRTGSVDEATALGALPTSRHRPSTSSPHARPRDLHQPR
jgi:hypothetical protein